MTVKARQLWQVSKCFKRDSPWLSPLVDFGTGASANDVAIQSDGQIVAVGQTTNGAGFAIARNVRGWLLTGEPRTASPS